MWLTLSWNKNWWELLDKRALIDINDFEALAGKISEMIWNSEFAKEQAKRNLQESYKYKDSTLMKYREAFYKKIVQLSI